MDRKITAIRVQKRDKERVNIFLDGEYAFALPMIEAVSLKKGQVLSDDDIAKLQTIDERHKAFDSAVRFLAQRPRSIEEIRRRLRKKEVDDVVIEEVIVKLENLGYVDDLEFAKFWMKNRETFRPRGKMALRSELKQKGISDSIIEQVLDDLDPYESARKAAEKKISRFRGKDQQTFRKKLYGHLGRRGFNYETISVVVNELIQELSYPDNHDTPYFAEDMNDNHEEY